MGVGKWTESQKVSVEIVALLGKLGVHSQEKVHGDLSGKVWLGPEPSS